jgi:hypothetical protein
MPYGQGQMLGVGVDPRMFVQDYSGFTRAAEIQAQGMQNLGAGIGQAVAQVGDYFKQQKEKVKSVDTASRIAGLLEAKAPDLVPGISELKATLDDQEIPLSQRISAAESLFGTMKTGFEVQQLINQNAMMGLRQQKMAASQASSSDSGSESSPSDVNPFTGKPY